MTFEVAGRGPIQSIAQPANGTCGIPQCNGSVYILLGRNCIHSLQVLICWCTSFCMPTHQKYCLIMLTVWLIPWCPFMLWNSTMIRDVDFCGTTITASIVYLSYTTFLRMLLLSSRKLGSGVLFISLTLFLQKPVSFLFLPEYLQIKLSQIIAWFP